MKILMIGPPGCGKGTIGEKLSDFLKVPSISSGQLLRDLPESHPPLMKFAGLMIRELAPKDFVAEI
jgi:adenylate kinase